MKRRRPFFINIAVVFFLVYYLLPIGSLFTFTFDIVERLVMAGGDSAFFQLKASARKQQMLSHLLTIVATLSLAGLLSMNRVALLAFTSVLVYQLAPHYMTGNITPFWTIAPSIALVGIWYSYFHVPKAKVIRQEVHRSPTKPKRAEEISRSGGKKVLDELIY